MEEPKEDTDWQESQISGVCAEEALELDGLSKEIEKEHEDPPRVTCPDRGWVQEGTDLVVAVPGQRISDKPHRSKHRNVLGIEGPWLLLAHSPRVRLNEESFVVSAPAAPCPSLALIQEFESALQGSEKLCLGMVLHIHAPPFLDKPPCDHLVISRRKRNSIKLLMAERIEESLVLEDASAEGVGATGHARDAAVEG